MLGQVMFEGHLLDEEEKKRRLARQREEAKSAKVGDVWFRYDDKSYAVSSGWDDDTYTSVQRIEVTRFKVVRVTPKGVQLAGSSYSARHPRLVLHDSYKRFACATQELALESYLRRKAIQAAVYESRANKARSAANEARQGRVSYVNDPDKIPMTDSNTMLTWRHE